MPFHMLTNFRIRKAVYHNAGRLDPLVLSMLDVVSRKLGLQSLLDYTLLNAAYHVGLYHDHTPARLVSGLTISDFIRSHC